VFCGAEHRHGIFAGLSDPEHPRQISSELLKRVQESIAQHSGQIFHMMRLCTSIFFDSLSTRRRVGHEAGLCPDINRHNWRPQCTDAKTVRPPEKMVVRGVAANGLCTWNGGYAPEAAPWSPGRLLLAAGINKACALGYQEYDLLRGVQDWKARWANRIRDVGRLQIPVNSLHGAEPRSAD
jgi:hypothetical protein